MAIALDAKRVGYFDSANLGNAANVVACQVNQHHMLGTLFGVANQFHLGGLVQLSGSAARAGAGQGADRHFLLGHAIGGNLLLSHQNLGAGPHHLEIAKVVVIHIGAGVQGPQRAVQTQGRLGVALLDALADLYLHEVAPGDQFFGPLHGGDVVGLGKITLCGIAGRGLHGRNVHRLSQTVF